MNNLKGKKYAQQTAIAVRVVQKVLELQTINNTFLPTIQKGVTIMKNSMFSRLAVLTAVAVLLAASTQQLFAAGTRAGTKLTSTATIQYKDKNNADMPNVDGEVSIYVAHKPASTLVVGTADQEGYDGGFVVYELQVTNNGNGQDKFQFLATVTSGGTYLDSIGWYKDGGLTEALLGNSKNVLQDTVTNDGNATVYAKVYLTSEDGNGYAFDGNAIAIDFYTRSTANNLDSTYATEDDLYARVVDLANLNALSSSVSRATRIKQSKLELALTRGQAGYQPGAITGYNATITNTGTGRAENVVLKVAFDNDQTFSSGTNWSDDAGTRTYNFGTIASLGGEATTIADDSLKLLLADVYSVLENSQRTPTLSVTYNDSTNGKVGRTRTFDIDVQAFTVLFKSFAPTITAIDTVETGDAGDSVTFVFTIQNKSNGYDLYDVRQSLITQLPNSWETTFYYDKDDDGVLVRGVDSIFVDAADGHRTPTHVERDGTIRIFIRNVIPSGLTTATVYLQYKGSSARDSITAGDFNLYGNVTPLIPNIVVTRARVLHDSIAAGVGGAASIAPGGSATFYVDIINNGTGKATNVIITDDLGARTEFAPFGGQDTVWVWDGVASLPAGEAYLVNPTASFQDDSEGYSQVLKDGTGYVIKITNLDVSERRRVRYRVTLQ